MSYDFYAGGSLTYLNNANTPVTESPFTLSGWFATDDTATNQTVVALGRNSGTVNWARCAAAGAVAGNPGRAQSQGSSGGPTDDEGGYIQFQWHHIACVAYGTSVRCYFDGVNAGPQGPTGSAPDGLINFSIGTLWRGSSTQPFNGKIAEVSLRSIALSATEVAQEAAGRSALFNKRGLKAYLSLRHNTGFIDEIAGLDMAADNGGLDPVSAEDHPLIYYPRPRVFGWLPAAPAVDRRPRQAIHRKQHIGAWSPWRNE